MLEQRQLLSAAAFPFPDDGEMIFEPPQAEVAVTGSEVTSYRLISSTLPNGDPYPTSYTIPPPLGGTFPCSPPPIPPTNIATLGVDPEIHLSAGTASGGDDPSQPLYLTINIGTGYFTTTSPIAGIGTYNVSDEYGTGVLQLTEYSATGVAGSLSSTTVYPTQTQDFSTAGPFDPPPCIETTQETDTTQATFEWSPSVEGAFTAGIPQRVVATGELQPTLTLSDEGQNTVSGTETADYYLSPNPDLSGGTYTLLGTVAESVNLQPNDTLAQNTTIQLPSSAHPGSYYLVAQLSGIGTTTTVASQQIMIVPKIVTVITPGFLVGQGGIFSSTDFNNISNALHNDIASGSALDGNTYEEVTDWNSTQNFAQALLALAAEQLGPSVTSGFFGSLAKTEGASATLNLLGAARSVYTSLTQNELVDPGDAASSGPNEQIIDLIGHSRGADLNSSLAYLLNENGYHVDSYVSLDGFGSDWAPPANEILDPTFDNVDENVALAGVDTSVNYMVQDALFEYANQLANGSWISQLALDFVGTGLTPAAVAALALAYPNERAPARPSFTFNTVIPGDGSSFLNGQSAHTNITGLFTNSNDLFYYPDGTPTYEKAHYNDPIINAAVTLSASPASAVSANATRLLPAGSAPSAGAVPTSVAPSTDGNFRDGNFTLEGDLIRQLSAGSGGGSDPSVQALLSWFGDPTSLLSAMWDVSGAANLVEDGSNTGAELTETANTSIGQSLIPTGNEIINFDLSNINANAGDQVEVLFNGQLLGSVTLQGAARGSYSVPFTGVGTQPGELRFRLTGPTNSGASVTLEDLSIVQIPTVTGISPGTGPSNGGTSVTVTGTGFTGATAVNFGSVPATSFTVNSAGTQITAIDPAGSGTADVTVITASGTSAASPADQFTYGSSLPAWIGAGSAATWNSSTKTLTVTGPTTIIADPGTDEPNIVAAGSSATIAVTPATSITDVHIGGITLSNGACLTMSSVGADRTHSNHNVLVIGTLGSANDPTFSIDSSSKLDLTDNDLIVHTGSSDSGNGAPDQLGVPSTNELAAVRALALAGRNVAAGGVLDGTWTGNGLTSSSAASADSKAGYEQNVLAVVQNSDQILGKLPAWTVGSFSEPLGANDIIVKYTYNGDAALEGFVGDDSVTIVNGFYDGGKSTQNDWAFGDFTGGGKVDDNDITILNGLYGNGTASSGLPQL